MAGRTHTVRKRQQAASLAISSLLLTDSIRKNAVGRSLKDEKKKQRVKNPLILEREER